ncbi:hypothetical protein BC829DRAFT_490069 [Chytridium lagenaria]|nr:hypothetical protein BC829DRAFT_490069 [Chytridium lagenaria]
MPHHHTRTNTITGDPSHKTWDTATPFDPSTRTTNASDIVMGDLKVFGGTTQFTSTMKVDYHTHSAHSQHHEDTKTPAGKSLGISNNAEIHVVFGDNRAMQNDRFRSVTSECYRDPLKEPQSSLCRHPRKLHRRLGKWEGRTELIMAAAHVGVKTREDLPIDDKKFRSFLTTNQEAYHLHPHQTNDISIRPKGGTSIPQGDREKQLWVDEEERRAAGAVLEGDQSSIAFGESIQVDEGRKATGLTVTQRDFKNLPLDIYVEARKKAADSKPTSYVGDGLNLGSVGALRPHKEASKGLRARDETQSELSHLIHQHSLDPRVANRRGPDIMYRSSIVTGDPRRYALGNSTTTTSASFQAYPDAEFPTFPVAGANITRSDFTLGNEEEEMWTPMVSTAKAAFVDYGRVEPASAANTLLFPIRTHPHSYETTTHNFFRYRDGIVNVTKPETVMHIDNRLSSIAFGDRTHFNTLGLPVQQET